MDHLIARVKSASKKETLKLKKVLSNQTIFENVAFELMPYVSYDPDHNLDSDTWFCIEDFSQKSFFLKWLSEPFDSVDFDQLTAAESDSLDYICSYQSNDVYCFQRVPKSVFLKKRTFLSIGDSFSLEKEKSFLIINPQPDAVYFKSRDMLLFKSLPTISSIFKGIDILYREATEIETIEFLHSQFISLSNEFSVSQVSKPNRHRISMAIDALKSYSDKQRKTTLMYIHEYCPDLSYRNGQFTIGSDSELKLLLYGIDQRFYTTEVTKEKRLANSVLPLTR